MSHIPSIKWILHQYVYKNVKNNNEDDKDILSDNPMNDNITEDGLTMTVNIQEDNIYKYAHVHCYVADSESYAMSELKRYLEVINIQESYISQDIDGKIEEAAHISLTYDEKESGEVKTKDKK